MGEHIRLGNVTLDLGHRFGLLAESSLINAPFEQDSGDTKNKLRVGGKKCGGEDNRMGGERIEACREGGNCSKCRVAPSIHRDEKAGGRCPTSR